MGGGRARSGSAARFNKPRYLRLSDVTILRVGTSQKYSDGWAAAFGGKKAASSKVAGKATTKKKAPAKKTKKSKK
jgi:hypothetical protein